MPKLKLSIDSDINFNVAVTLEAFGLEAMMGVRRKKAVGQTKLSDSAVDDLEDESLSANTEDLNL